MENTNKKGFPLGFYVCALSFTFERLAYYAAKWGLSIFPVVAAFQGGLGLTKAEGALLSSWLVAFTYITPMIGGFIADRWISPRILVPLGEILMGLGYLCAWQAQGKGMLILMIALVAIGTGFFKGNVSGINGRQFDPNDSQLLIKVFSWQYSFVNIGSFCGTTFLALIGTNYGYRQMFLACGVFMFIDVIWWLFGSRFLLNDAGKKPFKVDSATAEEEEEEAVAPLTANEKKRVAAILIVTVFSGIFWLIWYMAYLPVYYEFGPLSQGGSGWANWTIGNFEMPTAWFDSANGLFCILLCPVFVVVWKKLSERPQGDWSMWKKTATGILLLGLCVVCMVIAAAMAGEGAGQPVGIWIILLTAFCMTVGEVVFSPLGNSFISEYAPKQLLGTLLGVWPLVIFFAGLGYGPLYNFLATFSFVKAYGIVAALIIVCGVVMLATDKAFQKLVDTDETAEKEVA